MSVASAVDVEHDVCDVRTIVGASARGASHVKSGRPCQDAFCALEHDGAFAIAVADGLGSAARSDLGSQVATLVAVSRAVLFADDDPAEAAFDGIAAARAALSALAGGDARRLSELACTLMVVAGNADGIGIAHIGDGAVVGRRCDEWSVLSPPGPSEYLNETDPLTARDWDERVRLVCALDDVDGLALFTDGCQHAALRRSPDGVMRAHDGFLRPLFEFARSGVSLPDARAALGDLLAGRKLGEHSDDDKTLVLAVL